MNQASVLEILCFVQVVSPFPIHLYLPSQICFAALPQQCCVEGTAAHSDEKCPLPRCHSSPWPVNIAGA